MAEPAVTLVVTSYRRFDLLHRTLASFFKYNEFPLARAIVVEDSGDEGVRAVTDQFRDNGVELLLNSTNLGQRRSIDRAYGMVDTEYIFHCEDDWEFGRSGIIAESMKIIRAEPKVLMVLARQKEDFSSYFFSLRIRDLDGVRYRRAPPDFHDTWYTFSFNPGLRRLEDHRNLPGGYQAIGNEAAISRHYKGEGWFMAFLEDARVRHTGGSRSTRGSTSRWRRLGYYELAEKPMSWLRRRVGHVKRLIRIRDD